MNRHRNHAAMARALPLQRGAKLCNSETRRVLNGFGQFKVRLRHARHGATDRSIARPPRARQCTQSAARNEAEFTREAVLST